MVDFWAIPCRIFKLCLLTHFVILKLHWRLSSSSGPTLVLVVETRRRPDEVIVIGDCSRHPKVIVVAEVSGLWVG